jgi:hypothetical protein
MAKEIYISQEPPRSNTLLIINDDEEREEYNIDHLHL